MRWAAVFNQKNWRFTGASGRQYSFTILPKGEGLPESPGVFIKAYTHPRGHMAGWCVTPLFIGHADNIHLAFGDKVELTPDQAYIWNCNFVLVEPAVSVREECVRDLKQLLRCD
jgi:hypothetical protein